MICVLDCDLIQTNNYKKVFEQIKLFDNASECQIHSRCFNAH